MKTLTGVLPWVVVMAAAGAVVGWLLSRDAAAGRWLFAALLAGHGAVHLLYLLPREEGADWPFDLDGSWLASSGPIRTVGVVLIAATVAGFVVAALCAAGVLVPAGWWQPVLASASVVSAAVLVLFFHPQLVLGLAIDGVLVWVALSGAWAP